MRTGISSIFRPASANPDTSVDIASQPAVSWWAPIGVAVLADSARRAPSQERMNAVQARVWSRTAGMTNGDGGRDLPVRQVTPRQPANPRLSCGRHHDRENSGWRPAVNQLSGRRRGITKRQKVQHESAPMTQTVAAARAARPRVHYAIGPHGERAARLHPSRPSRTRGRGRCLKHRRRRAEPCRHRRRRGRCGPRPHRHDRPALSRPRRIAGAVGGPHCGARGAGLSRAG